MWRLDTRLRRWEMILLSLLMLIVAYSGMHIIMLRQQIEALRVFDLPFDETATTIRSQTLKQRLAIDRVLELQGHDTQPITEEIERLRGDFAQSTRAVYAAMTHVTRLAAHGADIHGEVVSRTFVTLLDTLHQDYRDFVAHGNALLDLVGMGRWNEVTLRAEAVEQEAAALERHLVKLFEALNTLAEASIAAATTHGNATLTAFAMLSAVALVTGLSVVMLRRINARLYTEITEHKQVTAALRESEARYRVLVESSIQGFALGKQGTCVFANAALAQICGYASPTDLIGQPMWAWVAPHDRPRIRDDMAAYLRGEPVPARYTYQGVRPDGILTWLERLVSRVSWDGEPTLLTTHVDITERMRLEDELLKAKNLESLGVLAGGIAHDFNNILMVILGTASLAKTEVPPYEKTSESWATIEQAATRATALTQQLLTFATGGAPIRHTASISDLLTESAAFVLHGANVTCTLSIPDDLWPAEVDIGQMSQVLTNVLLNADQAMPVGGSVHVRAGNCILGADCLLPLQPGRYLTVGIRDQGCGIPEELLGKVFDPYFTTKDSGSGLGLATAYAIVRKHDGYMTVDSEVGVGTTVSIYLPASQHDLGPEKTVQAGLRSGTGRILIMDDETAIRELAGHMLSLLGYEVTCAHDGLEAIALYQRARASGQPFVAVLLDVTIPGGMGGQETLEALRAIDPQVKAVVSSGYANNPVMANFQQYGFTGVLAKPYTFERLSHVLQRTLTGNEG